MTDLDELASRLEIQNVIARYAHAVDRRDFDTVRECYHEDAYDDHGRYKGGLDGLIDYMHALAAKLVSTYHLMGTPYIEVDGDTARVETFSIYRRELIGDAPVLSGLRYADTFERRDGRWRIAKRLVILDWEHLAGGDPRMPCGPEWLRGALGEQDPAYAMFQRPQSA
ncbi:nuclear transport factor 2 family protein [Nocardioides sp. Y6]|uniref:Nuclear transport factor 2 family protein n=1 Tax=Nocardioides malaquae TaxID=2773426 RepID=A0ABR9RT74_9ACTN|nr:nuclear transport factor 2 family protein [Nocardioides malaquae]MBE7324756.1 nuclear transport factor 2 family protein [Nocardioides malaquae]